jgi:hypothetical protein
MFHAHPALKRWATVRRPSGTRAGPCLPVETLLATSLR